VALSPISNKLLRRMRAIKGVALVSVLQGFVAAVGSNCAGRSQDGECGQSQSQATASLLQMKFGPVAAPEISGQRPFEVDAFKQVTVAQSREDNNMDSHVLVADLPSVTQLYGLQTGAATVVDQTGASGSLLSSAKEIPSISEEKKISHLQVTAHTSKKGALSASPSMHASEPAVGSDAENIGLVGSTAAAKVNIDQEGYKEILELRSNAEMETFMRRTMKNLNIAVADEQAFKNAVPWFSGEQGALPTFGELKGRLLNMLGMPNAWVVDPDQPPPAKTGKEAPVTDEGYAAAVALHSNEEMGYFMEKVVKHMGLVIADYGGIQGLAPFYSGDKMAQTLSGMEAEILQASRTPGSWVHPAAVGSTDESGSSDAVAFLQLDHKVTGPAPKEAGLEQTHVALTARDNQDTATASTKGDSKGCAGAS